MKLIAFLLIFSLIPINALAKKKSKKEKPAYEFTIIKELKRTPVKSQWRTGTCWIFSAVSFLESELLRAGKEELDLAEMFVARHAYPHKALSYVRLHGQANFGQGGQFHDVIDQIKRHGIVPEIEYAGLNIDEKKHNHSEMSSVLSGMLDGVLKRRGRRLTPKWMEAFEAVLDVYLGKAPEKFDYKGKTYTPQSFVSDYLQLNLDDYIEITSYTHHPFYKKCRLEVPDNWTFNSDYYNVPLDDLEKIVYEALDKGYTVAWDADVSDKGFSPNNKETLKIYDAVDYAIVPLKDWEDQTKAENKEKFTHPVKEKEITPGIRQKSFENFNTTDDHLMHIVGIAKDQTGKKFFYVKNSWGTDRRYKGYNYVSMPYFRLHTIAIMINKNALPAEIKTKLEIE
jgi:bleomycin hydrolase